jgi:M6 family metalloprotease-like protein
MKRIGILSILILISGAFLPLPATGEVLPGTTCPKVGKTNVKDGLKYFCVKRGDKTVWGVGLKFNVPAKAKPNESAIKKSLYALPTITTSNIEACKIKEMSNRRAQTIGGFPTYNPLTAKVGTVKWALVPIDFTDLPGEANFMDRVDKQMKLLSEWYYIVSEGKFKVEWVVSDKWITLPGRSADYKIPFSQSPTGSPEIASFWRKAISTTDKEFNYKDIQVVNFILPKGQTIVTETLQGFPWDEAVSSYLTNEGKVSAFSIAGRFFDQPGREYWSYWAHEFGHAIGLPHIGSSYAPNPFQSLDLMGSQDGPSRELSGWLRFIAGWLDDEKVYCKELSNLSSTDISLIPLNGSEPGLKMVVVALSQTRAVIIESRRVSKFSCSTSTPRNGVLAYLYDASLGHGEELYVPVKIPGRQIEGSSCGTPGSIDNFLRTGEKVAFEGVLIEVLSHDDFDRIRISKAA